MWAGMKSLHRDAVDSHQEIQEENAATRVASRQERQHIAAMEDLGLEDGEEALQYALMLSMEAQTGEGETGGDQGDEVGTDEAADAVRAVEAFQRAEDDEVREVLDMIRRGEDEGTVVESK